MKDTDLIEGKWYVLDRITQGAEGIMSGPHDTKGEAEKARTAMNIAGDCVSARYKKR